MPTRPAAVATTPRDRVRFRMVPAVLVFGAFPAQAADPAPASIFLPAVEQRTGSTAGQPGIFLPRPGDRAAPGVGEMPVRSGRLRTPAGPVLPGLQTSALPTRVEPTGNQPRQMASTATLPAAPMAAPVAASPRAPIDSQARLTARILTAVTAALGMKRQAAHQAGAPHKTGAGMPAIPAMAPRRAARARPGQARASVPPTTAGIVLPPGGTGDDLSSRINRAVRVALADDGADGVRHGPETPAVAAIPAAARPEPVTVPDEAASAAVPASAGEATASRADRLSARILRAVLDALATRKP